MRLTAGCVSICRWYNQLDPSLKKETFTYDEVQWQDTMICVLCPVFVVNV